MWEPIAPYQRSENDCVFIAWSGIDPAEEYGSGEIVMIVTVACKPTTDTDWNWNKWSMVHEFAQSRYDDALGFLVMDVVGDSADDAAVHRGYVRAEHDWQIGAGGWDIYINLAVGFVFVIGLFLAVLLVGWIISSRIASRRARRLTDPFVRKVRARLDRSGQVMTIKKAHPSFVAAVSSSLAALRPTLSAPQLTSQLAGQPMPPSPQQPIPPSTPPPIPPAAPQNPGGDAGSSPAPWWDDHAEPSPTDRDRPTTQ